MLTKDAWIRLTESAVSQSNAISNKGTDLNYDLEISAKNGGTETVIDMITELESTLRVMKRRLVSTLPVEVQIERDRS